MRVIRWLIGAFLLGGLIRADAPPPAPEVLVAEAASLYASIAYRSQDEDEAVRKLAAALAQEPTNRGAQELLSAIQKRREERRKQKERQGQETYGEQREGERNRSQAAQQNDRQEDERGGPAQPQDELAQRKPDEGKQAGREGERGISRADAERLLDALEAQEERPTVRPRSAGQKPSRPHW